MRNRQKVFWISLFILLLAAVFYSAKGVLRQDEDSMMANEPEVIQLKLWHPWASDSKAYKKYFLEAVEEYNDAHPLVQVMAEGIETELYREKLPAAIASNDTPDIYFCYTGENLENIIRAGKVLNLSEYLSEEVTAQIEPDSLHEVSREGDIYGLSFAKNIGIFLCNKEMFEQYGVEIPNTWEELEEACRVFREKGVIPLASSGEVDVGFRLYLQLACANRAGAGRTKELLIGQNRRRDEFLEGVRDFERLAAMGAFGSRFHLQSRSEVEEEFYLSRIPMYLTKSEYIGNITRENSPLYGKIEAVTFLSESGGIETLGGTSEAFVVNGNTLYPRQTVEALREITQNYSKKLFEEAAGIPTWRMDESLIPKEKLYNQIYKIAVWTEYYIPYWEVILDSRRAEKFIGQSCDLYEGKTSPEIFVEQLLP